MIEKKSLINTIKKALQTGSFNYAGQDASHIPKQLFNIDQIQFDDANWWECLPITRVDVSNNELVVLPQDWSSLPDLQLLRAKNNRIAELPITMLTLAAIKSLDLSRNCLKSLPFQISMNQTLVELNFAQNQLEVIPDMSKIDSLQHIYLNNNRLRALPDFGVRLKKLQASNNSIAKISQSSFWKCSQLQTLNLNKNQLKHIEKGAFERLKGLVSLQLKENCLTQFNEIPRSQKLDTINLAFNSLCEYNHFADSPNLTVLILANNKLRKISGKQILLLKKLKTLDLQNNDLPDIPCEIGLMVSIVRLQVEGNPLKTIRQNIRNGGTNVLKKYLKDRMAPEQRDKLQGQMANSFEKQQSAGDYWAKLGVEFNQGGELLLKGLGLNELRVQVFGTSQNNNNIKGVNIADNQITDLCGNDVGNALGKMQSLRYLVVDRNGVQALPEQLGQLPHLESIEAKANKISSFGSLKNHSMNVYRSLRHLDLSANRLSRQIPTAILHLQALRTLYLSYNKLNSIQQIWQGNNLPVLQVLDVSNNSLDSISDNVFSKALTLNFLNIQNNSLTKLPTLLGFMKLSALKVDGNPLKLIKRTVIDKGTIALLEFLRNKHTGPVPKIEEKIEQKIQIDDAQGDMRYEMGQENNKSYQNCNKHPQQPQLHFQPPVYKYDKEHIPQEIQVQERGPSQLEIQQRCQDIDNEIKDIQYELESNYSINNMAKNQLKRKITALQIERNKLLKQ